MRDRKAVRLLKLLHDNEKLLRHYTLSLGHARALLGLWRKPMRQARLLVRHKLAMADQNPLSKEIYLSITAKGMHFVEGLDRLRELLTAKPRPARPYINYDLGESERRCLNILFKLQLEGSCPSLKELARELNTRPATVSRTAKRLAELGFLEKEGQGSNALLKLTESGAQLVREKLSTFLDSAVETNPFFPQRV